MATAPSNLQQGGGGIWAPIVTNPLQTTVSIAVVTVVTVPVQPNDNLWNLYKDETDTWYVNTVTQETVWTLPQGAVVVE